MWQVTVHFRGGEVISGRAERVECYVEFGKSMVLIVWERDAKQGLYESEAIDGMYLVRVEVK